MNTRDAALKIDRGVDPTEDWRAGYIWRDKNSLLAAAHDLEGLEEIFHALISSDLTKDEALSAWDVHRMEIRG